jgi:hypothetical protein
LTPAQIRVRRAPAARVVSAVVGGGLAILVAVDIGWSAVRGADLGGAPIAAGMVVFAAFIAYRNAGMSLRSSDQELVVRNYWRTHHVPVSAIEGFDLGRTSARNWRTVRILTAAGPIPVDVLGVPRGGRGRRAAAAADELERRRQELADWQRGLFTSRTG